MAGTESALGFLNRGPARVLTLALVAQLIGVFAVSRKEIVPPARPLAEFPRTLGGWSLAQEGSVEKEIMDVLRADDVLTRNYTAPGNRTANLFVAYFKSQRTGQAPHSPKNCLPGSGWVPSESGMMDIAVPGRSEPIRVNRYVVSRGEDQSLVLYWYQSRDRAIASEYRAKLYLVEDAIRYNRTDTALVRVVVPVAGSDIAGATATAADFVKAFFTPLRQYLPS
ncbi:MAG: exosortase C-terminal domain/associated protein EpsI [Acidobacteriota bacterium]